MSGYIQQAWEDGVTPVDAGRMGHIESGIAAARLGASYLAIVDQAGGLIDSWPRPAPFTVTLNSPGRFTITWPVGFGKLAMVTPLWIGRTVAFGQPLWETLTLDFMAGSSGTYVDCAFALAVWDLSAAGVRSDFPPGGYPIGP